MLGKKIEKKKLLFFFWKIYGIYILYSIYKYTKEKQMKKNIYILWVDIYLQGWYLFIFYFYFESKWCCFPWLRILQEQKKKESSVQE